MGTPYNSTKGNAGAFASAVPVGCTRCFHITGEHLLCRDHNPDFKEMTVPKSKQYLPPPDAPREAIEPLNLNHPWWDFLDGLKPTKQLSLSFKMKEIAP